MAESGFDAPHLRPRPANFTPLTPLDLLARTLAEHPERPAVAWRGEQWDYAAFGAMVARLTAALRARGIGPGDVVSVRLGNRPEMLAAHFAVPACGAVLNAVNTRLSEAELAYILDHSGSRLLICDAETRPAGGAGPLAGAAERPLTAAAEGVAEGPAAEPAKASAAEAPAAEPTEAPAAEAPAAEGAAAETVWGVPLLLLCAAPGVGPGLDLFEGPAPDWQPLWPEAETQAIGLNYTSGTTGRPKGVVITHRGAYLNALGNLMALGLTPQTRYLWTLPMFHCNGWCHTWAVTAAAGLHVCLDRVEPGLILDHVARWQVTHMCCAPVVLYMLMAEAPEEMRLPLRVGTGGAAPSPALLEALEARGTALVHLYGLTESYGPATLYDPTGRAAPGLEARARALARQGRRHITAGPARVRDETGAAVPPGGCGEIVLAGNTVMAGYFRDPEATEAAFAGGGLRTGDIARLHPDGQIEITDRAKDVIISGGENISSLEVEAVLHKHPAVLIAAVVAAPDPKWGEIPCAFIELRPGAQGDAAALEAFCRARLSGFKRPRRFVFGPLPKTATGKIRKVALRARLCAGPEAGA
jgi:fatty-acyl-CoA synthase